MMKTHALLSLGCLALALSGCAVGPDYVRPSAPVPDTFKQAALHADTWQPFSASNGISAAQWWQVFNDPVLNALQEGLAIDNQSIRIAEAQYRAARAALDAASAAYYPTIGSSLGGTRAANASNAATQQPVNTVTLSATASWELDVWGRIRRNNEAAGARVEASAADLAAARLSAQALLTQTYFQLRAAEAQVRLLDATVIAYTRSLTLIQHRRNAGVASPLDLASAESQLATARASLSAARLQAVQLQHAIATLLGKAAAQLDLAESGQLPNQPAVPELIPSIWLTTRPDIAAAERRVAAANAQIGVATAAWFPALTLSGNTGYRNDALSGLISSPNRFWSVGPALALTLFDAGVRRAAVTTAEANYDQTVATYRQTVLTAMQEVEDNLAAASLTGEEKQNRELAAKAATRSREIAEYQYAAGTSGQLELSTAQGTELTAARTLIDARLRHLLAAVQLFKNLGGLPAPEKTSGK